VEQTTDRRGLHIAQLAHLAMQQEEAAGDDGAPPYPEREYLDRNQLPCDTSRLASRPVWITGLLAVGLALYVIGRRPRKKSGGR
jgi:hypothetical protein